MGKKRSTQELRDFEMSKDSVVCRHVYLLEDALSGKYSIVAF
jgi:hypothetical protein